MTDNIILWTDSYKTVHADCFVPKLEFLYSYMEARGGVFPTCTFFGLQYILKKNLVGKVVTKEKIDQAEALINAHMGGKVFNREGWEHILKKHDGKLPLRICSVQEGTEVNNKNVLLTIENTDKKVPWLTNYVESVLLHVWYSSTVATLSNEFWKLWNSYLTKTGTPEDIVFKTHDFGFRGVSSNESAEAGGIAHMLSFKGSDNMPALQAARAYYSCPLGAYSLPATEHSTMTSWGIEHEVDAYRNVLNKFPDSPVSVVSDSWSIRNAISEIWGKTLKEEVLARTNFLAIRLDSGDPASMVLDSLRLCDEAFGSEINQKGYRVLNPKIRLLQGDGINLETARTILHRMEAWGWSADNVAFGIGGALLQKLTRDDLGFALKASHATVNGIGRDIQKNPATDPNKKSKPGRLALHRSAEGFFWTGKQGDREPDYLQPVFLNGELVKEYTLDQCRKNLERSRMENPPSFERVEQWVKTQELISK